MQKIRAMENRDSKIEDFSLLSNLRYRISDNYAIHKKSSGSGLER